MGTIFLEGSFPISLTMQTFALVSALLGICLEALLDNCADMCQTKASFLNTLNIQIPLL